MTVSQLELTAVILWEIWQNRNNVVLNAKHKPSSFIIQSAVDLLSHWQAAHAHSTKFIVSPNLLNSQKWMKPPVHFLKCNVDAAIFSSKGYAGFGCIIRDHLGYVIAATHGRLPGIQNPSLAEALGIREALSWIKSLNLSNILVESDALLIVKALNSFSPDSSSSVGLIVEDCISLALEIHCFFLFVFVRRSANQVTHALVKAFVSLSDLEVRVSLFPMSNAGRNVNRHRLHSPPPNSIVDRL